MTYTHDLYTKRILKLLNYIIFVCDVDEIPHDELYENVVIDYNQLHSGAHNEMIIPNFDFSEKKKEIKDSLLWRWILVRKEA
jgi:hypothetical protein